MVSAGFALVALFASAPPSASSRGARPFYSGLRMVAIGAGAGSVSFAIGHWLGALVT